MYLLQIDQIVIEARVHLLGHLSIGLLMLFWEHLSNLLTNLSPINEGRFVVTKHLGNPIEIVTATNSPLCIFVVSLPLFVKIPKELLYNIAFCSALEVAQQLIKLLDRYCISTAHKRLPIERRVDISFDFKFFKTPT